MGYDHFDPQELCPVESFVGSFNLTNQFSYKQALSISAICPCRRSIAPSQTTRSISPRDGTHVRSILLRAIHVPACGASELLIISGTL